MELFGEDGSAAAKVAIYAALTYDIISATNSSPQTTEINASVRAETLMKWVKLGLLQAALFGIMGVVLEANRSGGVPWAPAVGSGVAGGLLWFQYEHAKQSGLENGGATTEKFGGFG